MTAAVLNSEAVVGGAEGGGGCDLKCRIFVINDGTAKSTISGSFLHPLDDVYLICDVEAAGGA